MHNGIYYAAVRGMYDHIVGGIYVSVDGENWVCAYRVQGAEGFHSIAGYANGYLWGVYSDPNNVTHLCRIEPVNSLLVEGLRLEGMVDNILTDSASSSFEMSHGDWDFKYDVNEPACGITALENLHGDHSLKLVCADNGYGYARIVSPQFSSLGGNPSVGDYICASFWIKGSETWPDSYRSFAEFSVSGGGVIDYGQAKFDIMERWQKITVWGRCLSEITGEVTLDLILSDYGYDGTFSDATCYIDCVQVVYSSELHNSGSWQLGGVVRESEYGYQYLSGLSEYFTSTFEWRPELSSREWHSDISLANWTDGLNSVDLYYDSSLERFCIDDGISILTTEGIYTWEHMDSIKFSFSSGGGIMSLGVESPLSGSEHTSSVGGLSGSPVIVEFGRDSLHSGYSSGLVTTIRHWDRILSPGEVGKVWDIYGPRGDITDDWYVDGEDFSEFSGHWLESNCAVSGDCYGVDIDGDGEVGFADLQILVDNWLEGL
jgi:hypothetical protein